MIAFAYNLFEGTLFFHSADASGIRNSVAHVIGIFSGIMIPIYLFPDWLEKIVKLTPFPSMVFGPVNALNTKTLSTDIIFDLGVAIFWSIALNLLAYYFWQRSTKKYEAVGI